MSSDILFIHINEWGEYRSPDTIPISQAYQLACLQANGFSDRILGDYKDRLLLGLLHPQGDLGLGRQLLPAPSAILALSISQSDYFNGLPKNNFLLIPSE